MKRIIGFWIAGLVLFFAHAGVAKDLSYNLKAQKVADGVYVFIGSTDHFNRENGGNIVNTGFLIGETGVVIIDSGPSLKYGNEMRSAIAAITPKPVRHVIITHHHPDHFLGNQAFDDSTIWAMDETIKAIEREGEGLLENMYHMVGDWMIDTILVKPDKRLNQSRMELAGRQIQFIPLQGHTAGDLVVFDQKSGVLFTGDLAFHNRTATTPHADIEQWIHSLDQLARLPYSLVVPGHGPLERDGRSFKQTKNYLIWLRDTLHNAAQNGLEMTEVMRLDIPARFQSLSLARTEFVRSVAYLWPAIAEQALLPLYD
jgi:uncharacterized sulfatase